MVIDLPPCRYPCIPVYFQLKESTEHTDVNDALSGIIANLTIKRAVTMIPRGDSTFHRGNAACKQVG